MRCIVFHPSSEQPSASYPLILVIGRELYAFNAGTMTARSKTAELTAGCVLDISPTPVAIPTPTPLSTRSPRYGSNRHKPESNDSLV